MILQTALQVLAGCSNRSKQCLNHRVFHNEVQGNFRKHYNLAHNRKRGKGIAGKTKHEILASAAECCSMVCHHLFWHFTGHFVGHAADLPAKGIISFSCLFHDKKNSFQKGRHPKCEYFAGRANAQPNEQPIWHSLVQEHLRRVGGRTNNRLSFPAWCKPWAWECFHLCFQIWPDIHRHGLSKLAPQVLQWRGPSQSGKPGHFYQKGRKQNKAVWLLCARQGKQAHTSRAVMCESVHRGLCVLHSRGPS